MFFDGLIIDKFYLMLDGFCVSQIHVGLVIIIWTAIELPNPQP